MALEFLKVQTNHGYIKMLTRCNNFFDQNLVKIGQNLKIFQNTHKNWPLGSARGTAGGRGAKLLPTMSKFGENRMKIEDFPKIAQN